MGGAKGAQPVPSALAATPSTTASVSSTATMFGLRSDSRIGTT
jgi:hypothetical protein